jgi:hypothetical protein
MVFILSIRKVTALSIESGINNPFTDFDFGFADNLVFPMGKEEIRLKDLS